MGAADRLHTRFRKSPILDLSFLDQISYCFGHFLDRYIGVNAMLVEQIDDINFKAFERTFDRLPDMHWLAVKHLFAVFNLNAEFGGNDHLSLKWCKSFTHQFFVGKRTVHFGSIKEADATIHSGANQGDHLLFIRSWTITIAHPHTPEPQGRDFQITVP